MWFWRDSYFQTLKEVAAEANACPAWAGYASFCLEYERGLRRQAFAILDRFISKLERASFAERRSFVSWLMHRSDSRHGSHMLVPHPLQKRIVEPTLSEWIQEEPGSSEPHRWLGGYTHLKRAIELDPSDEIARRKFIFCILGDIDYATHELPDGYLGDPNADLACLAEAEAALSGLSKEDERMRAADEIVEYKRLIEDYLSKQLS